MNGNEIPERLQTPEYLSNKQTYVRLFCPSGFLTRAKLLDILCPYNIFKL